MKKQEALGKSNRVFGLDIYRAFAIIWVVLGHGSFLINDSVISEFPYFKMLDGVDLFFVLSGFLIGGILLKSISKDSGFGITALFRFWKRRWFRTLPNYFLILIANYFVVKHGVIEGDIKNFSYEFFLFIQNFQSPFHGFFWESWSLSIEEWFYIFAPVLILIFLRLLTPRSSFLIATMIMILGPLIYRFSIIDPSIDAYHFDVIFRKTVLARLDSIGYGLLAAWFFFYFPRLWSKYKTPVLITGITLIVLILNFKLEYGTTYMQTFYFSLSPLAAMLLLPWAEAIKKGRGLISKAVVHISKISYSMYLINLALVAEVIRRHFPPENGADGIIKYLIFWAVVIGASTIIYKFFEKPMMDLRDKI